MAKQTKEIVKASRAEVDAVSKMVDTGLSALARVLSAEVITTNTLAAVFRLLRDTKKVIDKGLEPVAKEKLVTLLKDKGEVITEKGSRALKLEGWKLAMKPYRTGLDPKRVEGLLRAKSIDPSKHMRAKITYELDEEVEKKLVDKKIMTIDELETCKYEESWVVETPEQE